MATKSKNEYAWEQLFAKYSIIESINSKGFFEINSSQINEFRESRLMAKFDHSVNLPKIFHEHKVSILPISRYKYVIGRFQTHFKVPEIDPEVFAVNLPEEFESISYLNLYSESAALNFAYISGIIDDFIGEKAYQTISGRMSTGCFNFRISHQESTSEYYNLSVINSQCEIDAGFESENYIAIVEAKNYSVGDFLIRQIYYPFRLWNSKVSKKIIPILMTLSNDIFSFYEFEFKEVEDYTSICFVRSKKYTIQPEPITLADISSTFRKVEIVEEPEKIPFPQADSFERVIDLLGLLVDKDLTKNDITENYQFDIRQTQYYTDAGRYLGLIDKYKDDATKDVMFQLTEHARKILVKQHKQKYLSLTNKILSYRVFYATFDEAINLGAIPSLTEVSEIMLRSNLKLSQATLLRRARTVRSWINWIWEQIEE